VLDGYGDKTAIEARCEAIRQAVEESTSDYDKCAPAPLPVYFVNRCVGVRSSGSAWLTKPLVHTTACSRLRASLAGPL